MITYEEFLRNKTITTIDSGFEVDRSNLNRNLFEYQKDIVTWALKKGKAAIFADCGLG